jgi:hypothetical protein
MDAFPWRVARAAFLTLLVTGACHPDETSDTNNLRADVLYCEDALAYLSSCCPDFHADAVRCHHYDDVYQHNDCGSYSYGHVEEEPALSLAESQCILAVSCAALPSSGMCARAQAALPYTESSSTHHTDGDYHQYDTHESASQTHPPVCP